MNFDQPILDDDEIDDLIQEVRAKTGKRWKVVESSYKQETWFGFFTKKVTRYRVYAPISNAEFLVVRFRLDDKLDGYGVDRDVLIAFLIGLLGGEIVKSQPEPQPVEKVCSNCLHSGMYTFDTGESLICHLKYSILPTYASSVDPKHTCNQYEGSHCDRT